MRAGWEIKRLGEVCEIIKGRKPVLKSIPSEGDFRYLVAKVLRGSKEAEYASVHDRNSIQVNESEIIIICDGSNSGEIFIGYQGILSSTMGKIVKKAAINDAYLRAFLDSTFDVFNSAKTGSAIPHLDKEGLYALKFPFPPFSEQQRIVALLDEAFAAIATAKANAEKNLNNARALFDSYLNSVFSRRGDGWVENKLVSLTTKIGSGATPRGGGESYKTEGTSLIRSLNVHDPGFRYSKLAFLDDGQADGLSNVIVQPGDVLLNITGASVARCCIVPDDVLPARVNQHVSIIRPISSKLDSDFLHYLLISKYYKDQLLQTGAEGGATRQAITKAQIQDFTVGYPAERGEQQSIVSKLDALRKETQHLESIYQKKIEALDVLKKSILHQAFNGEL